MATYRDEGIVLRTMRLGEADRIVTMLTAEHGKVRAVGKGIRRTKSRIGGRLEPLSHVSLLCWKGRELDVVNQAESLDAFREIRDDLDRLSAAMTLLEIVDQTAEEQAPAPELFQMTLGALRTLEREDPGLVLGAFCWKLLAAEGVGPIVDRCARCGSSGPLVALSLGDGGLVCERCRRGQAVSLAFVALVQAVMAGRLGAVLRSGELGAATELERLGVAAVEAHLDRRLRAARHGLEQRGA